MNLLTSKASIYRHQKAKPSKGKASEMSNEDDDRSSLFSDGLQRAASVLSSRRSMSRRFRSPHDYVKEESVTEKFKHEVQTPFLSHAERTPHIPAGGAPKVEKGIPGRCRQVCMATFISAK